MALSIKLGVSTTKGHIYTIEKTGDYSSLNTGGFGAPNPLRGDITKVTTNVTQPNGTVVVKNVPVVFITTSPYTFELTSTTGGSAVSTTDGVYQINAEYFTGTSPSYVSAGTTIVYGLYDYNVRCALGKLALSDLTKVEYGELKLEYDRMVQAFECEDYTLVAEILADINEMLVDCNGTGTLNCGCGC